MYWILITLLFNQWMFMGTEQREQTEPSSLTTQSVSLGPPRQLSLMIACETARPCIMATWLPPLVASDGRSDENPVQSAWNNLVAYRVRYQLVAAIEPLEQGPDDWLEKELPFLRMVEKNVTRLQFSTTAGEHLFGVAYEIRVAAVGNHAISPEVTERILIPEAAPSDAPIDFRVANGDETSVQLTWKPPRFQYRNGRITQYQVRCYILGDEEGTEKLHQVTETELHIADLQPATHACLVRAWTKVGSGPWSNRILFRIQGVAPPTPVDLHAFRSNPTTARLEWNVQIEGVRPKHFVLYYTADSELIPVDQWNRRVTKGDFTYAELDNLDPKLTYAVMVSSIDATGREGQPSETVYLPSSVAVKPSVKAIPHSRSQIGTQHLNLLKYPDYFAVRNLKCAAQTANSIGLEWIGPIEYKDLVEYEITLNGRKEFLTEHGVLKAVHLGGRQLRQVHREAKRFPKWYKTSVQRETPDQVLLQFLEVTDLEPYSRYEFIVRPLYRLHLPLSGLDQSEGISVTVICHTDWEKPQGVKYPELEAIHPPIEQSAISGTLIELRIQRVSEQNGPVHEYFVLAAPYSCPTDKEIDFSQPPEQFSLKMLSDNLQNPVPRPTPYLAIRGSPKDLFKSNHDTAIVILGNEHPLRVSRAIDQYSSNKRWINRDERHSRTMTHTAAFTSSEDSYIRVANKAIDMMCNYRVALIACSKHPDGRYLCAYSPWSEPIHPKSGDPNNMTQISGKSWRSRNPSKFTIILIGLTCGLVFFALLSIILACVLRYRKRQLTERHILGSATQWDAQFCGSLMKSLHADESETTLGFHDNPKLKGVKSFRKRVQPSALFYSLSSSGLHSLSNSSVGLQMMRPMYPSAGGLAAAVPGRSITSQSLRSTESPGISVVATEQLLSNYIATEGPEDASKSTNCTVRPGVIICDHIDNGVECHTTGVIGTDMKLDIGPSSPIPTSQSFSMEKNNLFTGRLPISVPVFVQLIRQNGGDWTKHAHDEFRALALVHNHNSLSTVHGSMEQHKLKNRHHKLLPYDHNRVVLKQQYGTAKTDYINASYVAGYRKPSAYIATQAPLNETTDDFWSMVWEQHCCTIVMLCQLVEKGESKCDRYWPMHGSCHYGRIKVTHLETTELAYYVLRKFLLQFASEQRTVWQLQFTEWPTDQMPKYATAFLTFLRRTGAISSQNTSPLLVHCTSGSERTGIFIAIDILLEQAKVEGTVDIPGLVMQLRKERMGMIETPNQYEFIYRAITEAIVDGNTEVLARNFFTHIQQLDEIQTSSNEWISGIGSVKATCTGLGLTGFQLEFRKINAAAPFLKGQGRNLGKPGPLRLGCSPCANGIKYIDSGDEALSTVNLAKNRILHAIPFDSNRVSLCPIRGVDGSDYINASYVDGYQDRGAYIACQAPMVSTVEDFWRMVWEQKSDLIVMLCNLAEGGKEKCHQYWPSFKPSRYQFFVIDPTAEYNMSGHILREFKITDARDGESRTVRHFQYTQWPERGVPESGDSLIDLIGQVHKMRALSNEKAPVTVHCSSGTGRTGVFIALANVFERLRQESVVDMYATVKRLRQQRVGLVQTEEQYRFCYMATLDYLTSFDLCTQPTHPSGATTKISTFSSPCPHPKVHHIVLTNT